MKVLLIAGHGGSDPGACAMGYKEADQTRVMAPLVKAALESYKGVSAAISDTGRDTYTYLKNGGSINFAAYNLVIELHFNACVNDTVGNGVTTGTEVLYKTSGSNGVAERIAAGISRCGLRNRGAKQTGGLLVLNTASRYTDAVLAEVCFIDDRDDMSVYAKGKQKIADAIGNAVAESYGLKKEEPELTEKQVRDIAREETKNYLASLEKLPPSDWAAQELAKAKANGITDGTAPQAYATREQVAVMIQRTK